MTETGAARKDEEVVATEVRDRLTELMNRACIGRERFVFTVHGKKTAALVGIDDLDRLRSLDSSLVDLSPNS